MNHNRLRTGLLIGATSLVLGIGTTATMAGAGAGPGFGGPIPATRTLHATALAGAVVDVTV